MIHIAKTRFLILLLICAGACLVPVVAGEGSEYSPTIPAGIPAVTGHPIVSDIIPGMPGTPGETTAGLYNPSVPETPVTPFYPAGESLPVMERPFVIPTPGSIPGDVAGAGAFIFPPVPSTPGYPSDPGTAIYPVPVVPDPYLFPNGEEVPPAGPVIPSSGPNQSTGSSQAEKNVIDANNRFALDLYRKLASDPGSSGNNLFFSPFSISSAIALTWEGARGSTADEIRSVFHFPEDAGVLRQGYADIIAGIAEGDGKYTLRSANALWAEKTCALLPGYVDTAREYYAAPVTNVDFITLPEDSRITINHWVEDRTEGKIVDLLPPGSIDESTRLVITNAVYFKGTWVKQFDAAATQDAEFTIAEGSRAGPATTQVRMMQRTDRDAKFGYAETEQFQALRMPYASDSGKQLSMLVILPKGTTLDAVGQSLTTAELAEIRASLEERRVKVYFPMFRLETTSSLGPVLAGMGMPTAFSDAADLSGIAGTDDLCISDVVHKAFVEVNEEGTEAAAATGVIIGVTSIGGADPVPVFMADHPFLFLIIDDETGNILFMGRVVNPGG